MTEYELNILRSEQVLDSLDIAINVLNNFEHHSIGQPISLLYKDIDSDGDEVVKLLLAVGKKVGGGDSSYYEIINRDVSSAVTTDSRYVSRHELTEKTYADVGAVFKGTTLEDIYKNTNNGNISKLFDYIFFRPTAVLPTVTNPYIVDFYLKDHQGEESVKIKEVPLKEDFIVDVSRGSVSHGTDGDDAPYSGTYETMLKLQDSNGDEVNWSSLINGGSYKVTVYVIFNIGTNQPLDSDDKPYGSVCTVTYLYKSMNITIEDNLFGYAGMVYDEAVGFKTKIWSSLTSVQRESVVKSLINTSEYKYSITQLTNKVMVSGKGTIDDATSNKGRLVVLVPKALQSKLVVEQNRAGVFVPWVMDVSMDVVIDEVEYTAYMAASQHAIMTKNNSYRISIEK